MSKLIPTLLVLAIFATTCPANAEEFQLDNGAIVLTDSNFATALQTYNYLFVTFYAPWLTSSTNFVAEAPKWAKAMGSEKYKVTFAKVDATTELQVAKQYDIYRYPQTLFFYKGDPLDYDGPSTEANVTAYLKRKIESLVTKVSNVQEFVKIVDEKEVALLFFGTKKHQDYPVFNAVSKRFDSVGFAYQAKNADLKKDYRLSPETQVLLIKKFDEGKVPYKGELTLEALTSFIESHRFPAFQTFDDAIGKKIFLEAVPTLFLMYEQDEEGQELLEAFKEATEKTKGKIFATACDYAFPRTGKRLANFIEVSETDLPVIKIVWPKKGVMSRKYHWEKDTPKTAENIVAFVDSFKNGTLPQYLPGEPIPDTNDQKVKVVVKDTFKDIVLDPTKDVFIEFHAPRCHHCKKLIPIWEELAETVSSIPDLVIAKIDGQNNGFENIHIPGFPMLRFYPANKKDSPIDFEGERTLTKLLDWLRPRLTVKHTPESLKAKEKVSGEL